MKKIKLTVIALFFLGSTAFAQSNEVQSAFNKMFPSAENVKWSQEDATQWEAEFNINDQKFSANFSGDGTWLETERELSTIEIPTAINTTIAKEFADYQVKEAELSETKNGTMYEFDLVKDKTVLEVAFSRDGTVVKKEVKIEKDND
ncbi:MAG: hypothetical protein A3K10_15090 [Bacteroidetes bacterium RIFCSPLOWO2_12_FULL_31_6]|nr:MAG: hypothetical protein A3K10_15090 [Bacteroidetes bacterium RIFCSPLOWO2_12_FULL_31_6]